ncbi:MAG: peptidylprolyl isomerase [Burkholderiales bacterium]|nr:peptidylprolyl isomerase [Burkholderiales bacterium]
MNEVLAASPASDWRSVDPENTVYVEFPQGRVVIELAPNFAPKHTANIKALVREGYFDGLAIVRSQDNYVVQWGDPDDKNPRPMKNGVRSIAEEFTTPIRKELEFTPIQDIDGYAPQVGFAYGMPAAQDPKSGKAWMAHCYGMVGAGRDIASDSGSGAELYVVNGHAPRHLDRNVTLVGRVLQGMPLLSSLPRGTGPLGFYEKPEQNVPLKTAKMASDVPPEERVNLEVIKTNSATFKAAVAALRNRGGDWYKVPAGHIELCNIPLMVRVKKP